MLPDDSSAVSPVSPRTTLYFPASDRPMLIAFACFLRFSESGGSSPFARFKASTPSSVTPTISSAASRFASMLFSESSRIFWFSSTVLFRPWVCVSSVSTDCPNIPTESSVAITCPVNNAKRSSIIPFDSSFCAALNSSCVMVPSARACSYIFNASVL